MSRSFATVPAYLAAALLLLSAGCGRIGFLDQDPSEDAGTHDAGDELDAGGLFDTFSTGDVRDATPGFSDSSSQDSSSRDSISPDSGRPDFGADADVDGDAPDAAEDATIVTCETDCGDGTCFLTPDDGYQCIDPVDPGPGRECEGGGFGCRCASSAECDGGVCLSSSYRYCGGARPPTGSSCRSDGCAQDSDCELGAFGACLPRGYGGSALARCARAACRTSADCRIGGTCSLYDNGCGDPVFFCRYPDDVCLAGGSCRGPELMICVPNTDGHGTQCIRDMPPV